MHTNIARTATVTPGWIALAALIAATPVAIAAAAFAVVLNDGESSPNDTAHTASAPFAAYERKLDQLDLGLPGVSFEASSAMPTGRDAVHAAQLDRSAAELDHAVSSGKSRSAIPDAVYARKLDQLDAGFGSGFVTGAARDGRITAADAWARKMAETDAWLDSALR